MPVLQMRNPKAGRAWESFGPDPYLVGEAGAETILGVQSVGVVRAVEAGSPPEADAVPRCRARPSSTSWATTKNTSASSKTLLSTTALFTRSIGGHSRKQLRCVLTLGHRDFATDILRDQVGVASVMASYNKHA
jgi:hypothetical protein